jgi:hypothetical protein
MADVQTSEVDAKLAPLQSTWNHEILYTDRSSKNEQLLERLFFVKKNTNMAAV